MKALERLARRICWLEFEGRNKSTTEARYWEGVHAVPKAQYIEEARRYLWMSDRLRASWSSYDLAESAIREYEQKSKSRRSASAPDTTQ